MESCNKRPYASKRAGNLARNFVLFSLTFISIASASAVVFQSAATAQTKTKTNAPQKIYSPDKQSYAYVETSDKTVSSGKGDVSADLIWLWRKGEKAAHPLFKRADKVKVKQAIGEVQFGDIHDLCYSNDSSKLYFLNAAYAVSDALMSVDLKSGKIDYVIDANSVEVVKKGKWLGNLIVERHKYHDAEKGGAYEALCVVTPQGKELKQLKELE